MLPGQRCDTKRRDTQKCDAKSATQKARHKKGDTKGATQKARQWLCDRQMRDTKRCDTYVYDNVSRSQQNKREALNKIIIIPSLVML